VSGSATGAPGGGGASRLRASYFFVPFGAGAFALGVWGFLASNPASSCHADTLSEAALRAVMLVTHTGPPCTPAGISLPVQLVIAQFVLPFLLVLGTFFAAIKLVLVNLRHDAQLALVRTMRGHTIVCGLNETGLEAVRQLALKQGKAVAVAGSADAESAWVCETLGVPLITGDPALPKTLGAAGLARARAVVMCTGSDARNIEICLAIEAMKWPAGHELLMFPEVRGTWIIDTILQQNAPVFGTRAQLHPFRANAILARKLLQNPVFETNLAAPRLLLLGFGDLAAAILRRCVLSNYALPGVRVHAACHDAEAFSPDGPNDPPWWQFADLNFSQHGYGKSESADAAAMRAALARERPDIVIVTLHDDDLALRTATLMRTELDILSWFGTAIFVRVQSQKRLSDLLGKIADLPSHPHRLTGFGDLGEVVAPDALFDEQLDIMARAVHETYLARSTGDSPARLPWKTLPERYRHASRASADHIPVKLGHAGYVMTRTPGPAVRVDDTAVEMMAEAEHYRWSLELKAAGWRPGPERSDLLKTHPLLIGWDALPEKIRQENRDQIAMIPDIVTRAGFYLRRRGES
jgi:hypothetical protein